MLNKDASGAAAGTRLPSLTGARFLAAALVFAFHFAYQFPFASARVGADYSSAVANAGSLGVGFFFVLSGFVLTWTARRGEPARSFWRRRAAKIYPNHLVAFVAVVLLMFAVGTTPDFWVAASNVLLLHAWVPNVQYFLGMNDVTWTLSCEALFYLSFPLLVRLVDRVRPTLLWPAAAALVALGFAFAFTATRLPTEPSAFGVPVYQTWFAYIFPVTRCVDFVLGIVMARIITHGRWIRLGMAPAAVLVALAYWVSLKVPADYGFTAVSLGPLALFIAATASADLRGRRSPLRGRAMVWLGEVSFAFYLVHNLVLTYGHHALGPAKTWSTAAAFALGVVAFAASLAIAALLYRLVERPAMSRFARPRRRVPAPARTDAAVLAPVGAGSPGPAEPVAAAAES